MNNNQGIPKWIENLLLIAGISLAMFLFIELVKEIFKGQDSDKIGKPRVFISHSWSYDKEFNSLIHRFEDYGFEFYNHSVPKSKPLDVNSRRELLEGLRAQMKGCSKVIVLAGMYVNNSPIIREEIKIAKELKKEIIAIRPHGAEKIPKIIRENADKIIGTYTPSIVNKLKTRK